MAKPITMRDTFWNRVYELARDDKDVMLVIADMGAPSLDKFRKDFPNQFINVGIAEQDAILIAAGMAIKGKKVYAYAIAPFITMRCYEQIRLYPAAMNLHITVVGVGAGVCYEESGPTHHAVEDVSLLRILPNMKIYSASDNNMTRKFADFTYQNHGPSYVRLDRIPLPNIYPTDADFTMGLGVLRPVKKKTIIATGCMVGTALKAYEKLAAQGIEIGVLDAYRIPVEKAIFKELTKGVEKIYVLEEHTLPGGLGSQICELVMDCDLPIKVRRFGFDFQEHYCYTYGGRDVIRAEYGLDADSIVNVMAET